MADIKFNEAFFRQLAVSPGVTGLVKAEAEEIAGRARASAPVDTGDYRRSIHVEVKRQQRSVALVVADDPAALIIESKTGNLARSVKGGRKRGR